ncbi:CrcB family protein [Crocinitomicaceae bacterium]|nr:CrcB family protein [Crocinitomicaceae bacterium]
MTYLLVFMGGGLGSLSRFLIGRVSAQLFTTNFPLGTFISNMIACILLASFVLIFSDKSTEYSWVHPLLIVGFCGGFSTFSTFGNETFELLNSGNHLLAILNIVLSILLGVGLIYFIRIRG